MLGSVCHAIVMIAKDGTDPTNETQFLTSGKNKTWASLFSFPSAAASRTYKFEIPAIF